MRILIDLQGCQNDSRNRGIGRYTLAIAQGVVRNKKDNDVQILLSAGFPDTLDFCKSAFVDILSPEQIKIFHPVGQTQSVNPQNIWRRNISELLYEHFVTLQEPDVLLICDPGGGWGDQTVTSVGRFHKNILVVSILYDLIPLINMGDGDFDWPIELRAWYFRKLDDLRRMDLLLSISNSSKKEAVNYLGYPENKIVNILAAIDSKFHPMVYDEGIKNSIKNKYKIINNFIITASAVEKRKNPYILLYAFARLPEFVIDKTQLLIVGGIHDPSFRTSLVTLAAQLGLDKDRLLFSGHVSDDDLIALYSLCDCFVFPSFHEGFGLPPLEAMACGAPVLVSNSTSLPEVVDCEELLFDPYDVIDLANKLVQMLTNSGLRQKAIDYGINRAGKFSWDRSAIIALEGIKEAVDNKMKTESYRPKYGFYGRPRLAFVYLFSSIPSYIAKYSFTILPELSRFYEIDVVVYEDKLLVDDWIAGNANVRTFDWFQNHAQEYDRIIYQVGNSRYLYRMLKLLEEQPGIVVLHSFNLSKSLTDKDELINGRWEKELLFAHGWVALQQYSTAKTSHSIDDFYSHYPCNLSVLQQALGIVVLSEHFRALADYWYGKGFSDNWSVIPFPMSLIDNANRSKKREEIGIDGTFVVCAFGSISEANQSHHLIEAWIASTLMSDIHCLLVFVGTFSDVFYEQRIRQQLANKSINIRIIDKFDKELFQNYLKTADVAVHLCKKEDNDSSVTVLECMNHGVANIVLVDVNNAEITNDDAYLLDNGFQLADLSLALERLYHDIGLRSSLVTNSSEKIHNVHLSRKIADQYAEIIEQVYCHALKGRQGLITQAVRLGPPEHMEDAYSLAENITRLYMPRPQTLHYLFVDISMLVLHDAKTGVQRVTRNVLRELLINPPDGYHVEPVYATGDHTYRHARNFVARFLRIDDVSLVDDPILVRAGDIFWGLDLVPHLVPLHEAEFLRMRTLGVKVVFTVHDILPLIMPQFADSSVQQAHENWLTTISKVASGLLTVSHTVMNEVHDWLTLFDYLNKNDLLLGWSHNGADFRKDKENSPAWYPDLDQRRILSILESGQSFLMVGTIEPRKGHRQVLAAFEWLWEQGLDLKLVIVGKQGWKTAELIDRIRNHSYLDRYLFWLDGIHDDFLESIYASCICLIAASLGEGFGLPLVEAAQHGLPILARDIPVFREVAGDNATYFSCLGPQELGSVILDWLDLNRSGNVPNSRDISWLTWAEATRKMVDIIVADHWQKRRVLVPEPNLVFRCCGSNHRILTEVGERIGNAMVSTGQSGCLCYGTLGLTLDTGVYIVSYHGAIGGNPSNVGVRMDISCKQGKKILQQTGLENNEINQDGSFTLSLPIFIEESSNDIEARIWVGEFSNVYINLIEIRQMTAEYISARDEPKSHLVEANERLNTLVPFSRKIWATHPRMGSLVGYASGRGVYTSGKSGFLLHGPYIKLPAGRYKCQVVGRRLLKSDLIEFLPEIASNKSEMTKFSLQNLLLPDKHIDNILLSFEFTLQDSIPDIEVRFHVGKKAMVYIEEIMIDEIF